MRETFIERNFSIGSRALILQANAIIDSEVQEAIDLPQWEADAEEERANREILASVSQRWAEVREWLEKDEGDEEE